MLTYILLHGSINVWVEGGGGALQEKPPQTLHSFPKNFIFISFKC